MGGLAIRVAAKEAWEETRSFFAGASRGGIETAGQRGLLPSLHPFIHSLRPPVRSAGADALNLPAIQSRDEAALGRGPTAFTAGQVWPESTSAGGVTLRRGGDTPENRIWGSGQPLRPSPFRPAYDGSRTRSNDQQLRSAQYIELPGHATRNAVASARPPWPHGGASAWALLPGVPMYRWQPTAAARVPARGCVTPPRPVVATGASLSCR